MTDDVIIIEDDDIEEVFTSYTVDKHGVITIEENGVSVVNTGKRFKGTFHDRTNLSKKRSCTNNKLPTPSTSGLNDQLQIISVTSKNRKLPGSVCLTRQDIVTNYDSHKNKENHGCKTDEGVKLINHERKSRKRNYEEALIEHQLPCDFPEMLSLFKHIIFVDLDNWPFVNLCTDLPKQIYVWVFYGGNTTIRECNWSKPFRKLYQEKRCFMHPKCGKRKNAADFAICVYIAKCDSVLKKDIHFTILSGDRSFQELASQIRQRQLHFVDPHEEKFKDRKKLYSLLSNIAC